ncbi:hypothetical protein GOP47_0030351 [Adiantum capillus-veneris]|nr:hypothetical protein GOP47_0030351 [Adiantum capillus-veneris]
MANFSLQFVPHLATISSPLRQLLHKDTPFNWTTHCEQSFSQLKQLIQQSTTLMFPDFSKPFVLQTDASNTGIGAVLLQQHESAHWRPISFISRGLTKAEKNYSTTEKELLAIVWAFTKLHPYLHGTNVTVQTDHQPLLGMLKKSHPPGRLYRWVLALQEYTFTLQYFKGKHNTTADSLSRVPHIQNTQSHTSSYTLPHTFQDLPFNTDQLTQLQQHDPQIQSLLLKHRSNPSGPLSRSYLIQNNTLYYINTSHQPRLYVPKALQHNLITYFHAHPLFGHLGFHRVLHNLRTHFFWPRMRQAVSDTLRHCITCQQVIIPTQEPGHLSPITVDRPFQLVGWDIMGPFSPTINGNRYIIVATEYLTRWCEAAPIPDATAPTVTHFLLHNIIMRHTCPEAILFDQGHQFVSDTLQILSQCLGVTQNFTSPYHPQANGLTERLNRTIKQMIAMYVDPLHQHWDTILPYALHAYNTSVQASTRISPFRALYERDPVFPPDLTTVLKTHSSKDALDWYNHLSHSIPLIRSALLRNLQTAQGRQKRHHDLQHPQQSYNPGDLVMLYFPLRRPGLSESLMHRWLGPYRITHQIKPTTYQLLHLSNLSKTSAHISRLKPYYPPLPNPALLPQSLSHGTQADTG